MKTHRCPVVLGVVVVVLQALLYTLFGYLVMGFHSTGRFEYVGNTTLGEICLFIEGLYRELGPGYGCLVESPVVESDTCYTSTNMLAVYVLRSICGNSVLAENVERFLELYKTGFYDYYQVLLGLPIQLPFNATSHVVAGRVGEITVKHVIVLDRVMEDYDEYANLVAIKAIHHARRGEREEAARELEKLRRLYNGVGFRDKAFNGYYETYKLALAATAYSMVGYDEEALRLLEAIREVKPLTTLYTENKTGVGDLNLETACLVAIAINQSIHTRNKHYDALLNQGRVEAKLLILITLLVLITILLLRHHSGKH